MLQKLQFSNTLLPFRESKDNPALLWPFSAASPGTMQPIEAAADSVSGV
jgi:hypothetical protein